MSYHTRPEYIAPQDQRCGAKVLGHKGWAYEWAKYDHQCPKKANQMRGLTPVCHLHAKAKKLIPWKE